jgi:putative transposase
MRMRRLKITGRPAVYHCVSRAVNRERLFNTRAKEMLRRMIWQVAEFSGVEVLSYCVMSNHFHVLVRVPDAERVRVDDGTLVRRYRLLYPRPTEYQTMACEVLEKVLEEGGEEGEKARVRLLSRMHDLSQYMKTLKQRFTVWYNGTYGRTGTLWSERYKSVLVEGEVAALQIVAGYIDLNPVRAGVVKDPKDYRWSSYGEAVGGSERARTGLAAVMASTASGGAQRKSWKGTQGAYRQYLYCKGSQPAPGKDAAVLPQEAWLREMERGGKLSVAEALHCRVRYFTDGAVIGSSGFVRDVLKRHGEQFGGKRRRAPVSMKGSDWNGLSAGRGLRREVFR